MLTQDKSSSPSHSRQLTQNICWGQPDGYRPPLVWTRYIRCVCVHVCVHTRSYRMCIPCFAHILRPPYRLLFCCLSRETPVNFIMNHHHTRIHTFCMFLLPKSPDHIWNNLHTQSTRFIQFQPICHHNLATHMFNESRGEIVAALCPQPTAESPSMYMITPHSKKVQYLT